MVHLQHHQEQELQRLLDPQEGKLHPQWEQKHREQRQLHPQEELQHRERLEEQLQEQEQHQGQLQQEQHQEQEQEQQQEEEQHQEQEQEQEAHPHGCGEEQRPHQQVGGRQEKEQKSCSWQRHSLGQDWGHTWWRKGKRLKVEDEGSRCCSRCGSCNRVCGNYFSLKGLSTVKGSKE